MITSIAVYRMARSIHACHLDRRNVRLFCNPRSPNIFSVSFRFENLFLGQTVSCIMINITIAHPVAQGPHMEAVPDFFAVRPGAHLGRVVYLMAEHKKMEYDFRTVDEVSEPQIVPDSHSNLL